MMLTKPSFNANIIQKWQEEEFSSENLEALLEKFLMPFYAVFREKKQRAHFGDYTKALLSDLARKSVEPIALHFAGVNGVRVLQQFLRSAPYNDAELLKTYQRSLSETINAANGMLSVDETDFVKKGNESAGVQRQYCGRLGKTENCQAGVFLCYAGLNGYGLVDRELYTPQKWFLDEYAARRKRCRYPEETAFETKNEIAAGMINRVLRSNLFNAKWIGCDSSFGCDHSFLDDLPAHIKYFAAVRSNELVFHSGPEMIKPGKQSEKGRPFQYAAPSFAPVQVKAFADSDEFPWKDMTVFVGAKDPVQASVKLIRCASCRNIAKSTNAHLVPGSDVWLYIRRYDNNDIKYLLSNAPADIDEQELHEAATLRWPIEQCFEECKSNLGMADYECRSYTAWMRHMLFVMIAHLFTTSVRLLLKKPVSI